VDLNRRLRLVEIRLDGTDQFTIDEIKPALVSQEANILGIIPLFGYGRGFTSQRLLDEDSATIRSLLRELGYRDATVRVNQGVSLDGENLIITFVVEEGEPTIVSEVGITGNSAFSDEQLLAEIPVIEGMNFSIAKVRNGQRQLSQFYSNAGYFDAVVSFSIDEITDETADEGRRFRVIYNGKP
jgi:outer membrane protein assembly factor BamA